MGNQNASKIGGFVKHVGIRQADNPSRAGIPEVDCGLTATETQNYLLVEVCVSLEPRPHALGLRAPFRAASSLE
jgi:hypothetical protein